jgi:uncharacterized phage protein gp47/JayE
MTTPLYGVTPQGFKSKRLIDIKSELEDYFISEFGDINLDPQSVAGQIIGVYSKVLADIWENMQNVYLSQYPNSASGISLDNVVQLNGITRLPAQQTSVIGVATGIEGTLIPSGSLARIPDTGEIFASTQDYFITRSNSVANTINVSAVAAQAYEVVINGLSYIYSLPNMQFSAAILVGQVVNARINGINMPAVPWNTNMATTLTDLGNIIIANTFGSVASFSIVGNSLRLVPTLGKQIVINSVNISGGGAPTYTTLYIAPASVAAIAQNLAAVINNSTVASGSWTSGSSFTIQSVSSSAPYSLNVGTNLQITQVRSPVNFLSQNYGVIPAPAGSLTEILTPVAGWQSITNFDAGITGREQETDEELRLRRALSLKILGSGTVEAIRSRILQEVPGVTSVLVFENVTMTQDTIEVAFSADFITGNNIDVEVDGSSIGSVNWTTDHITTMNLLATLIDSDPSVDSVVVGGVSNRNLSIEVSEAEEIEIDFVITGGASQPTFVISGGRPPKSFETVVEGGADADIALKIWNLKPAGIQTFGNTAVVIIDSQGNNQTINFSRATPIYLWANIVLVLNPQETFPANGQQLVSEAVLAYGNTLGIGVDVFYQRVLAQIFTVPGIASATVQLARTLNPTDTPSYSASDVDIGDTEVSSWDLSRIVVSI